MASDPDYIPEPTVILLGCQPWPPKSDGPGCPVCGQGIRIEHRTYHCAVCGSSHPSIEARCRASKLGLKARDKAETAEKRARDDLRKVKVRLSERLRRRYWHGYPFDRNSPDVTNQAALNRAWLAEIGQEPNWDLILDKDGRTVGRIQEAS